MKHNWCKCSRKADTGCRVCRPLKQIDDGDDARQRQTPKRDRTEFRAGRRRALFGVQRLIGNVGNVDEVVAAQRSDLRRRHASSARATDPNCRCASASAVMRLPAMFCSLAIENALLLVSAHSRDALTLFAEELIDGANAASVVRLHRLFGFRLLCEWRLKRKNNLEKNVFVWTQTSIAKRSCCRRPAPASRQSRHNNTNTNKQRTASCPLRNDNSRGDAKVALIDELN